MASRPSNAVGTRFAKEAGEFASIAQRALLLRSQRTLRTEEADALIEGLFVDLVGAFEETLESLFLGLITSGGLTSSRGGVRPHYQFPTRLRASQVVRSGKSYVNWLPYGETERRARIFFARGYPFRIRTGRRNQNLPPSTSALTAADRLFLDQVMLIRNAIAHRSAFAHAEFRKKVLRGTVPPRERHPAGHLQAQVSLLPPQSRFEYFAAGLISIAQRLAQ